MTDAKPDDTTSKDRFGVYAEWSEDAITIARPEGLDAEHWKELSMSIRDALTLGLRMMAFKALVDKAFENPDAKAAIKRGEETVN